MYVIFKKQKHSGWWVNVSLLFLLFPCTLYLVLCSGTYHVTIQSVHLGMAGWVTNVENCVSKSLPGDLEFLTAIVGSPRHLRKV